MYDGKVGFRTGDIIWFPVVQSLYTGVLGWILASAVFLGVAYSINRMLGEQMEAGQVMCQLMPLHYLIALGLTLGASVISAALAGFRSARIEPSDGLREI